MSDMSTAPLDGTRVLLKCRAMSFSPTEYRYKQDGWEIIEGWFKDGRWQKWCGNEHVSSTHVVYAVAWAPIPKELNDDLFRGADDK